MVKELEQRILELREQLVEVREQLAAAKLELVRKGGKIVELESARGGGDVVVVVDGVAYDSTAVDGLIQTRNRMTRRVEALESVIREVALEQRNAATRILSMAGIR